MPSPAWEDLDDFLDVDDFATAAVIHFQAGGERPVVGNFDDPYLNARAGEHEEDTTKPTLNIKESDAVGIRRLDWLVINGKTYDIMTGAQPDGTGMAIIELAAR